jgi:hypothetical protein
VKAKTPKKNRRLDHDLQSLLQEASRQPGLPELMQVYEWWRDFDAVSSLHQRLRTLRLQTTCSNASAPGLTKTL